MSGELPSGWAEARIGDLAELNPKQAFDDDTMAGFVPMSHAPTNFRDKLRFDERPWGEIKKAYTNFKDGDVIFAKVTPCFENGKAAFVDGLPSGIGAGSSEFFVLRPSCGEVSAKYLLALVKSHDFLREGAENMTGAVGLRRVPKQFVENYPVPVPPAGEQTRIAAKLDELLAQVDTLKARIDGIPALLKRFRQSVLAAAVSGRLTEEWRMCREGKREGEGGAGSPPRSWVVTKLDQCVQAQNGKAFPSADYRETGVRLIRPGNLHVSGHIVWTESNTVCLDEAYLEGNDRYVVRAGDIVMNLTAQSLKDDFLGRVCVYAGDAPALLNQRQCVFVFEDDAPLVKGYLFWYFRSPQFRAFVETLDSGSLIKHMYTKQLSGHEIAVPPIEEQTEIVRRVEQLFAFADQLEAKVNEAKTRIDRLTQSILAKAFRGELVPQDPNDEPASVLLERIKAQRASAPKAKRKRRVGAD
ncbi:type I restriction endonuclease subunit S [Azotobacter chroococcum subsp. isscasi]|uniref:restriction endonuclease subunit S n=1 Tax=Azotobacter chroococcum TaxID=353 RepID=UPI00103D56D4|nr:restriction endonuclease subunit S [Azotobacter chroococcum]TBW09683.1 type I restriction endonuclease subunit S [Azotobacter chroococcum subsp. isscasi]